ncbi:unnamed protein product [Bursaphelenchus okinawaensis]|uniref:Uncharacterized protein n=1 Tax=Bursaphelenchus okinawaensis TaxID=465554 RepID=A0A811JWK7_9BILA|nr:unnamed protein product [Bursaphelenchus okinawaensis]CAG9086827.1 unnamed protein product [Bursaphelenchus okinawaensis]
MGHKDTFVPLDEYPEVVSKPKTKGIKGQLLNKFKNIQTRFARDQPEPILRAPLAKPEESRECSIVSGYHQIENQKQHDAKDRRSPLTKLKQKLLLKDDNLQLKVDCMRTDEQRSRFKNFQSKSMDNDSSTDDYTEIPIDMSIKSSPVVPQRLTKMDQPRHHSLSKIPGKSRVMEQKILSGSYQIRVVKRPKSLDLERRIVHSWHSQISRMTENSVQDYRDGIFEDFYDDEVEEKLLKIELPKKQEKPMTKKADRKLEDLKEEYEPDEQFVDVSIRKPEEKSIFRLNLRPLERVNYEYSQRHNGKGFRLFGVVVDTETNHTYFVKDDAFPGYIDGMSIL